MVREKDALCKIPRPALRIAPLQRRIFILFYGWIGIAVDRCHPKAVYSRLIEREQVMTFKAIQDPVWEDFQAMKTLIAQAFHSKSPLIETIGQHILHNNGKCLRPLLLLLSSQACGYTGDRHIKAAALIELLHTATLLHDDVVDDAEVRRGQKTTKALWGNEAAILVGDFLYAKAFQLLLDVGDPAIMALLVHTTQQMAEGEALQLLGGRQLNTQKADYLDIVQAKTAKLFEACAHMGALLSHAPPAIEQAMRDYGLHLGTAFQLMDDVLDYEADPTQTGKDLGNDLIEGKMTLPLIYALQRGRPEQVEILTQAIQQQPYQPQTFAVVLDILQVTGALKDSKALAVAELDKAKQALLVIPDSSYKEALMLLANFVQDRGR